jgi:hypothetical protein
MPMSATNLRKTADKGEKALARVAPERPSALEPPDCQRSISASPAFNGIAAVSLSYFALQPRSPERKVRNSKREQDPYVFDPAR